MTDIATAAQRPSHQATFAVLAAAVGAYALLQSLLTPVLPMIQTELHTSPTAVTWVLTAYLLSAAVCTPIVGRVGDMIGKERVFVATLLALSFGSLLGALAPSMPMMVVARVIQGVGGGVLPLAFGIIRDEFPEEKVTGAVGSVASLTAVGSGVGIVLAGPLVDVLGWRWLFWIPMILTVAAAVGAVAVVPASPVRTPGQVSWLSALLLSAWLVALFVPLSEASSWGWGSGRVIGSLIAAALLCVLWATAESRARTPLVDLHMMRRRAVWTINLSGLLIGIGMYAVFSFIPGFVQVPSVAGYGFGASITGSGLMLLPASVMMFVGATYSGPLAYRCGGRWLVIVGCLTSALAVGALAFAHSRSTGIYLATGVMGIGFGLAFAAMAGLIVAAVPAEQTGVAAGMNANIRTIGGSIGCALMACIVTSSTAANGLPEESGYTAGFAMLAVGLLLAGLAGLLIPPLTITPSTGDTDMPHAALGMVAAGTLVGDESE